MKLLTLHTPDGLSLGVKTKSGVLDIVRSLNCIQPKYNIPKSMDEVIQGGENALQSLALYVEQLETGNHVDLFLREEELKLAPCIPRPGKIIGIGLNYRGYLKDSNTPIPEFPHLFSKYLNAVKGHGDTILLPFNSKQVDYEGELVIVIGKRARRVSKNDALDYVLGYCNCNDFSARDLQYSTTSWLPGKTCDGFCPIGPYLVTRDEVENPNQLELKTYVNGELRQNSNTSDMVFGCSEIISKISQLFTLEPGDIILTGTPEGIVMTYPEDQQVWLKDGDVIEVEIEKLGKLINKVKSEMP